MTVRVRGVAQSSLMRNPAARFLWIACVLWLTGCQPSIPNKVAPDEYELYSAWTTQHFSGKAVDHLFFSGRTFVFDPLERYGCGDMLHGHDGVPWSLIKQLHALGTAEYPLDLYQPRVNLRIPWQYKELDRFPDDKPGTYRLVGFSRVAFNRDHTEALFAVSDSCGGECGNGGAHMARREKGKRLFRSTACFWTY